MVRAASRGTRRVPPSQSAPASRTATHFRVPPVAKGACGGWPRGERRAGTGGKKPLSVPALGMERETGFGPATLSLGKRRAGLAPARTEPQTPVTTAPGYHGLPHPAHGAATDFPKFGATLGTTPRTLDIRAGILLTARDVALRLRVSTATVYALCRRGELGHHRVSNAIRVSEDALAIYLHGR